MTRYRIDTLRGRVVAFECADKQDGDDENRQQYENTHFDTHAEALAALVSSFRHQVKNAAVRFAETCRARRKARRELARTAAIYERLGGLKT